MSLLPEIFEEAAGLDAPLSQRLALFDQELRGSEPDWSAAYDALVDRLRSAEAGSGVPGVGELFPDFVLPDDQGHLISSAELLATGPLVISFNRGHWCEFCLLELRALQEIAVQAARHQASIVSITPELPVNAARCKLAQKLTFPLLCDLDLEVTLALGLAIALGQRVAALLMADGISLANLHGGAGWLLPIPATFVVSRNGRITARFVDVDFRRRMETADILAALAAS